MPDDYRRRRLLLLFSIAAVVVVPTWLCLAGRGEPTKLRISVSGLTRETGVRTDGTSNASETPRFVRVTDLVFTVDIVGPQLQLGDANLDGWLKFGKNESDVLHLSSRAVTFFEAPASYEFVLTMSDEDSAAVSTNRFVAMLTSGAPLVLRCSVRHNSALFAHSEWICLAQFRGRMLALLR